MQNLFRSRLPSRLTLSQITKLSNQSNLSPGEVEKWYQHFILCYPYGYVSFNEFLIYIKQLNIYHGNQHNQFSESMIKQIFDKLDLDKNKELNFEEFFGFNLLVNQGTSEAKLKFILNLYDQQKMNFYTQEEIVNILTNMFHLLNIPQATNYLSQKVNKVLSYINLNNTITRICWKTFCIFVLKHANLIALLLSNDFNNDNFEDKLTVKV